MNEVTRILSAIEQGNPHAAEQLLPLVNDVLPLLTSPWSPTAGSSWPGLHPS